MNNNSLSVNPTFPDFYGENGINLFMYGKTGCFGKTCVGISLHKKERVALLRSTDNTSYYNDDLSVPEWVEYTLQGCNGDQDEDQKKYNEPLLNATKTEHIYLYRYVKKNGKVKKEYSWYGKYEIVGQKNKEWPGKDNITRTIIVLLLKRVAV